jgi:2-dehydropantoate 2-reductase
LELLQNGLPFHHNCLSRASDLAGTALHAVDPDGKIFAALDPARVSACVAQIAAAKTKPGKVTCTSSKDVTMFTFGAVDDTLAPKLQQLIDALHDAGVQALVVRSLDLM